MPLLVAMGQAVPVWAIVGIAVNAYLRRAKEAQDDIQLRLQLIESNIHAIQISLASAGVQGLAQEIEKLKESKAQTKVQIQALWRTLDESKGFIRKLQEEEA